MNILRFLVVALPSVGVILQWTDYALVGFYLVFGGLAFFGITAFIDLIRKED